MKTLHDILEQLNHWRRWLE